MSNPKTHQIVIVGGGFAGVAAARRLARHRELAVTLISDKATFAYYPQLYHSATGGTRSESAIPLPYIFRGQPVKLVTDSIASLDPHARTVTGAGGTVYPYDELVVALGAVTNYFGIKGLEEFAYNIKTIEGAERFKRHLHRELVEDHKPDLNYVVVGGGPTGVELAAALGDYLRRITRLHGLAKPRYNIDLIEAAPRLLPRSPEAISAKVQGRLQRLGVTVMTSTTVLAESARELTLAGQKLSTKTVVWTAGVANNPFFKANEAHFKLDKRGKVKVDDHLLARPHVYVLGDNAATPFSGLAAGAVADAHYVAEDLYHAAHKLPRHPYVQKNPPSVIPVGGHWAAAQWGRLRLYGWPGYGLRRAADLIGYADIESWPQAIQIWLQEARREDNCRICAKAVD